MTQPTPGSSQSLILAAANVPESQRHILLSAAHRESTREAVMECNDCTLGQATTRVPWEGPASPVFLLGEAPGADEESTGRPFVGSAGQVLNECITAAGLKRSDLAIGNTIGCRPPRNNYQEAINAGAPDHCRRHTLAAITASQAWIVLLLGGKAIEWAKGPGQSVSGNRGRFWWDAGTLYGATFHPAYALRQGSRVKEAITEDLTRIKRILAAEESAPPVKHWHESSAERLMPLKDRDTFRKHYNRRGWVVLNSELIGSQLAITKQHTDVPEPWHEIPRYTLAEINKLITDPEMLRTVHAIKSVVKCEVVT